MAEDIVPSAEQQLRRRASTTAAADFVQLWRSGACDDDAYAQLDQLLSHCSLSGRMMHGWADEPGFGNRLSSEEWKRVSWVFGPEALRGFLGKSEWEICLQLGFGEPWLKTRVSQGKLFKLAVFPSEAADTHLATWDNIEYLLRKFYPEVWTSKIAVHYDRIRSTPFEELEAEAGYSMLDVNLVGRDDGTGESTDDRYISLQRLLRREGTLVEVRQFLYDELGLSSLFTGTGFTMDDDGTMGPPEYLCPTLTLREIPGVCVVDVAPVAPIVDVGNGG